MNRPHKHTTTDEILFDYLEGNLKPEEKKALEDKLNQDHAFSNQLALWQSAYVNERRPVFKNKDKLYRKTGGWNTGRNFAGLSVLLFIGGLCFLLFNKEPEPEIITNTRTENTDFLQVSNEEDLNLDTISHDSLISDSHVPLTSGSESKTEITLADKEVEITQVFFDSDTSSIHNDPEGVILDTVWHLGAHVTEAEEKPDKVSIEKSGSEKESFSKNSREKNQDRKKRKPNRKRRRRIRWEDVKRAWYNETTVVPMK